MSLNIQKHVQRCTHRYDPCSYRTFHFLQEVLHPFPVSPCSLEATTHPIPVSLPCDQSHMMCTICPQHSFELLPCVSSLASITGYLIAQINWICCSAARCELFTVWYMTRMPPRALAATFCSLCAQLVQLSGALFIPHVYEIHGNSSFPQKIGRWARKLGNCSCQSVGPAIPCRNSPRCRANSFSIFVIGMQFTLDKTCCVASSANTGQMGFSFSYEVFSTEFTLLDASLAHLYSLHSSGRSALTHTYTIKNDNPLE